MSLSRSLNRPIGPGRPLQLRPQLVRQRRPGLDQILPRATQRPERLSPVAIGLQHPEAMTVVRASSHNTNASNRSDLPPETLNLGPAAATWLGCSARPATHVQQPLDQHPVRALIATSSTRAHERAAQRPQPGLVARERARQHRSPASSLISTSCFSTPSRRPRNTTFHRYSSWSGLHSAPTTRYRAGAHRLALNGATSCAARAPHPAEGLVLCWPSARQARKALPRAVRPTRPTHPQPQYQ